jgi:ceramide glucosyltransferase
MDVVLTVAALAILVEVWHFQHLMRPALARGPHPRRLSRYPSLTVVRPIKGLDTEVHLNVRAALDNGYPGRIETLFVFDHEREPALSYVLDAVREHQVRAGHGTARVIFCGEPPPGRTGKLNAMIVGLTHATGELVAFADSDVRPDRRALALLVDTLRGTEKAGAAFAPVVVTSPPRTLGDIAYALTLDGIYGGAVAVAALLARGELPFIMGQLMVFERDALRAIGGLESVHGQFVDDMYIGARLREAGYRNVVSPEPVPIVQQGLRLVEFLRLYRRWLAFSLSGIDPVFTLTAFRTAGLLWPAGLLAGLALLWGHWIALGLAAVVPFLLCAGLVRAHEALGGARIPRRHAWVALALLVVTPLLYPTLFARRAVDWRGRVYELDVRGRLADRHAANEPRAAAVVSTTR